MKRPSPRLVEAPSWIKREHFLMDQHMQQLNQRREQESYESNTSAAAASEVVSDRKLPLFSEIEEFVPSVKSSSVATPLFPHGFFAQ